MCTDTGNQTLCMHSNTERAIQETWCSVELMKALEKGYRIVQMHEVWHFPQKSNTLFKEYTDTVAKIKLEASGYPKNCVRDEQKQCYVNDILENQGIQLDPTKINYNPGLRALAKLMLNSFWGKFTQQSNLMKTEEIEDPQVFFDYLTSDKITVLDTDLVSNEILEIRYEHGDKFVQPDPNTNVVIAAFTTTHARLQLYDELNMLQERVLYYDTDLVIHLSQPGQPEPRLGNYIGNLTNELGGNELGGDYITVFASGGPKNYCYKTNTGRSLSTWDHTGLYGATESQLQGDLCVGVLTGRMQCDRASFSGYPVQNHEKYPNEGNSIEMNEERLSYCLYQTGHHNLEPRAF